MRFGPTAAQEQLRERAQAFLEEVSPPAEVRRLMETGSGFDPAVWRRTAEEQGLQGIHLPAAVGGRGLGWVELAVVLEEAGRVLLGSPLLSTTTAAGVLSASTGDGPVDDVLSAIAAGRAVATLAVAEGTGRWDEAGVDTRAVRSAGGEWRLEGRKSYVVDGGVADVLVVAARRDPTGEVGLFLVDADAPGVSRAPLATVDLTRKQAKLGLAATPARPIAGTLAAALELAVVGLAAEQVGGAQRCLDAAVAHARTRVQFGRPIGSFQAVKHLCAEMLLDLESARSASFYAASAAARAGADLPAAAAVAKSCCSEAFVRVATDSLHVHGGLGFTWDNDAHLYFKRARSSALLFGDPGHHRELLARHLRL
jgi:alkylation response protein AidB-like acyl-CoA dehydrogenase